MLIFHGAHCARIKSVRMSVICPHIPHFLQLLNTIIGLCHLAVKKIYVKIEDADQTPNSWHLLVIRDDSCLLISEFSAHSVVKNGTSEISEICG